MLAAPHLLTTAALRAPAAAHGSLLAFTKPVLSEDHKIMIVVGGLVCVAIALTLLTYRYWRHTRPQPLVAPPAKHLAGAGAVPPPVADDLFVADATVAGAAAASAGVAAIPPVGDRPPEHVDGRSRRAVAGADHRAADEDWTPRGTGEHERVDVTATPRGSRPGRQARRAALDRDAGR